MKDIINIRLKTVYEFLTEHYKILLIFSSPIILVYFVLSKLTGSQSGTLEFNIHLFFEICFSFVYIGILLTVMIYIVDGLSNKRAINIDQLKHFFKTNILLITASVFIVSILTYIGFLLLIVPGIYALTRMASVPFLISLDNVKLFQSIDLSFEYSKKYTWPMFFCFLIVAFIQFNVLAILAFLQISLGGFIGTIVNALVYIIEIILVYHFYLDIKKDMLAAYNSQLLNPGTVNED